MRNQKELRYLITPANYVWSLARGAPVLTRTPAAAREGRSALDARPAALAARTQRPLVVVMVVGRNRARRQLGADRLRARRPRPNCAQLRSRSASPSVTSLRHQHRGLAALHVRAGGPPRLRRGRDPRQRIAAARAGARRRAACGGATTSRAARACATACPSGAVADRTAPGSVHRRPLPRRRPAARPAAMAATAAQGTQLLVLHLLGNHGPAYFRRYPPAFARFQPACETDDLRRCSQRGDRQRLRQRAALHRPRAGQLIE